MFNWLFRRRPPAPGTGPASPTSAPAQPPVAARRTPDRSRRNAGAEAPPANPSPAPIDDAAARLQAARGDDAALLVLATSSAPLAVRMAAVEAIVGLQTLKAAESALRNQDRKVHRLAKVRLTSAVGVHDARRAAGELVIRAETLLRTEALPVNHLVALDRAWDALDAGAIEPEQRAHFQALRAAIDEALHSRAEAEQGLARWLSQTRQALPALADQVLQSARGGSREEAAAIARSVQALLDSQPDLPATAAAGAALQRLLRSTTELEPRLAWLESTPGEARAAIGAAAVPGTTAATGDNAASAPFSPSGSDAAAPLAEASEVTDTEASGEAPSGADMEAEAEAAVDAKASADSSIHPAAAAEAAVTATADLASEPARAPVGALTDAVAAAHVEALPAGWADPLIAEIDIADGWIAQWQALPALTEPAVAEALETRWQAWLTAMRPPPPPPALKLRRPSTEVHARPSRPPRPDPIAGEQLDRASALTAQAEQALADGRLTDTRQWLHGAEALLAGVDAATLPAALRSRLQAIRTESNRLQGWQHWGGTRARDELVEQAEQLARQTLPPPNARTNTEPRANANDGGAGLDVGAGLDAGEGGGAGGTANADAVVDTASDANANAGARADAGAGAVASASAGAGAGADAEFITSTDPGSVTGSGTGTGSGIGSLIGADPGSDARARSRPTGGGGGGGGKGTGAGTARPARLDLKAHSAAILDLRSRWRALDRMGAAASAKQWNAFDNALQTAHVPLAAQQAASKAVREQNLAARLPLLEALEALPALVTTLPDNAATAADVALPATVENVGGRVARAADRTLEPPPWKHLVREMDRLQSAWRQLGPVEHTVPAAVRATVAARHRDAVARIDVPLAEARGAAVARREHLIGSAEALLAGIGSGVPAVEAARDLRQLQADWQVCAAGVPLPRALDQALWSRFRTATDAVFAQRAAASAARDAEAGERTEAARAAVLAATKRLEALDEGAPGREIEAALVETEATLAQIEALPRDPALQAAYRKARDAARQRLLTAAQREDRAQWDALINALASRERQEDGGTAGSNAVAPSEPMAEWPAAWVQALAGRPPPEAAPGPLPATGVDDVLLQLEAASDLPAEPQWLAARRTLKLRALKEALEGRASAAGPLLRPAQGLTVLIGQSRLTPEQRQRLHALLSAWRNAPTGTAPRP